VHETVKWGKFSSENASRVDLELKNLSNIFQMITVEHNSPQAGLAGGRLADPWSIFSIEGFLF